MPVIHNPAWEAIAKAYVLESLTKSAAYLHGFPQNASKDPGYIATHAGKIFAKDVVRARVNELQAQKDRIADKEFGIDALYVLRRLVDVHQMDIGDILDENDYVLPVKQWPKVWRQCVSAFEVDDGGKLTIGQLKKIKWPDQVRILDMIGKHVHVNAFKEVQEIQGPGGGPLRVISSDMSAKEAAAAYAATLDD